ncbi:hypothetical protein V8G54_016324 [Vigna mungo]|uniref:Uncharacterized protein n=1 Tax=Vigna mungo TaxID=3915 RepID=A0AAQ3S188_VIGMU
MKLDKIKENKNKNHPNFESIGCLCNDTLHNFGMNGYNKSTISESPLHHCSFFLSFSIAHPFSKDHKIHYHRVSISISNSTLEFSATHFDPNPEESVRGFHVPHHLSDAGGAAVPDSVTVRIPRVAAVAEVAVLDELICELKITT